jgi:hydroxylamine reductase
MSQNQMFCYQCEQTAKGQGCTVMGVCGKTPEVANLQDLLVYKLRELSQLVLQAQKTGLKDEKTDVFTAEALFVTLTNVNFDPEAIVGYLKKTEQLQNQLQAKLQSKTAYMKLESYNRGHGCTGQKSRHKLRFNHEPRFAFTPVATNLWLKRSRSLQLPRIPTGQKRPQSLRLHLGRLAAPLDKALGVNDFVGLVFKCGEINIRAMELLDAGNTETYGHPIPTKVPLGHKKGKAILVSGHDLMDLEEIAQADTGQRHQRLHTRRNAPHPRLPQTQKALPQLLRPLRHRMAKPAKRIRRVSPAPS